MKTSSKIIVGISLIVLLITLFYKNKYLKSLEKFTIPQVSSFTFDKTNTWPLFTSTDFPLKADTDLPDLITNFYGNSISKKTLIDPPKFLKGTIDTTDANSPVVFKDTDTNVEGGTSKQLIGFQPYILLMIVKNTNDNTTFGFYTTIAFKNIQIDGSGKFKGTIIEGEKDGNYYGTFNRDLTGLGPNKYILIGPLTGIPDYNTASTALNLRSFKVNQATLETRITPDPNTTTTSPPAFPRNADGSSKTENNTDVNVVDVLRQLKAKQFSDDGTGLVDLGTHSMVDCMRIAQWKKDDLGDTEQAYFGYDGTNDDSGKCYFIDLQKFNNTANDDSGGVYVYPLPDRDFKCINEAGETLACDQVLAKRLIEQEEKEKLAEIENINKQLFNLQIDKIRVSQASGVLDTTQATKVFYQKKKAELDARQTQSQSELTEKNSEIQKAANMQARYLMSFKRQKELELSKIRDQFKELNQLNADINRSTKLVTEERNRELYIGSVHNLLIIVFIVLIVIGFLMILYYNNKYSGAVSNFINNTKNRMFSNNATPPSYNALNMSNIKPSAPPANDLNNLF